MQMIKAVLNTEAGATDLGILRTERIMSRLYKYFLIFMSVFEMSFYDVDYMLWYNIWLVD